MLTNFTPPNPSRFTSAAYRGDSPPTEWLIEKRLPRARVAILAAQGGVGKSWALCEGFSAINDGGIPYVWGGRIVETGLPCVLLAAEDSFSELDNRLRTIRTAFDVQPKNHGLILPTSEIGGMTLFRAEYAGGPIMKTDAYEWLDIQLEALRAEFGKLGFLGIDTLSALANFSENDNGEATAVMQGLVQLASKHDVAVIVAHHFAKGGDSNRGQNAIRGASALVNSARLAFGLERLDGADEKAALEAAGAMDGRAVRMSVLKSNLNVNMRPVTLAWPAGSAMLDVSDLVGGTDPGAAVLSLVRQLNAAGENLTKTGKGGIYARYSDEWPKVLREMGKHKIEAALQGLIDRGEVIATNGYLVAKC